MKNMKSIKNILNSVLIALPVMIVVILLMITKSFMEFEYSIEDNLYKKLARIPNDIKIIAIDEATLKELGPYSNWNRGMFADLINILCEDADKKPELIAFDLVFTGTDNSESDNAFVEAAEKAGNVVLASQIEFDSELVNIGGEYYIDEYVDDEIVAYEGLTAVTDHGFTNAVMDEDGYIRRAYAVVESRGNKYSSFAYRIASIIYNNNPDKYSKADFNRNSIFDLVYTGVPGDFEKIPMSAVLSGSIPASYFNDSLVFVGAYEEGMMDAYSVPVKHGIKMYGVEVHANTVWALLSGKQVHAVPTWLRIVVAIVVCFMFVGIVYNKPLSTDIIIFIGFEAGYVLLCFGIYRLLAYKLPVIYLPIGFLIAFLTILIIKYIEMQKRKAEEIEATLFSMADAMAEAIDGRTPYNASHTKNVAKRSVEMVDYINEMHKEGRTNMHFTKADRKQLYLAAMLHDVGKMDVPTDVMDKPTKLGDNEQKIKDRLAYIKVLLERDLLAGKLDKPFVDDETARINAFLGKLGLYNCGKPLKPEDFAEADVLLDKKYILEDGTEIPYITKEESDSIHIKAGTLSDEERAVIQSHVTFTDKILSHVSFGSEFDRVRAMASNHHEVLNGKGYPKGLKEEELDTLTRILTIMDIYDALVADDRPYKKAKPIPVAFNILDEEAEYGKIDKELLAIAKEMYLVEEDNNAKS